MYVTPFTTCTIGYRHIGGYSHKNNHCDNLQSQHASIVGGNLADFGTLCDQLSGSEIDVNSSRLSVNGTVMQGQDFIQWGEQGEASPSNSIAPPYKQLPLIKLSALV